VVIAAHRQTSQAVRIDEAVRILPSTTEKKLFSDLELEKYQVGNNPEFLIQYSLVSIVPSRCLPAGQKEPEL
jgi:hypothetical protein